MISVEDTLINQILTFMPNEPTDEQLMTAKAVKELIDETVNPLIERINTLEQCLNS